MKDRRLTTRENLHPQRRHPKVSMPEMLNPHVLISLVISISSPRSVSWDREAKAAKIGVYSQTGDLGDRIDPPLESSRLDIADIGQCC